MQSTITCGEQSFFINSIIEDPRKILDKSKFYFYSSSPSWFIGHHFKWYKDIDFKKINTKAKIETTDLGKN